MLEAVGLLALVIGVAGWVLWRAICEHDAKLKK